MPMFMALTEWVYFACKGTGPLQPTGGKEKGLYYLHNSKFPYPQSMTTRILHFVAALITANYFLVQPFNLVTVYNVHFETHFN